MNGIILTKSDGIIIGNLAKLLGLIMNGIFNLVDMIGIHNIGLTIILFTIVVNLLMMPLTLKQQKFSKLSSKISPEIKAIQAKYKNRRDTESAMMQNQEIQAVYAKYGVSPSGSCLQLLIQMPILFALYRVIYAIPAYVTKVKDTFTILAEKIINSNGGIESFVNLNQGNIANTIKSYGGNIVNGNEVNGVIDVLNKLSVDDMAIVAKEYGLADLEYNGRVILGDGGLLNEYNSFFGINIANTPKEILALGGVMIIAALMFPLLSALTQWINTKLIPHNSDNDDNPMASSMKTMSIVMPLISAWFCYMMPCGMGIYWIAGSVVRSVQQVAINKHFDKMDFEEIIKQNEGKSKKKLEKLQKQQEMMNAYASMKTKSIQSRADIGNNKTGSSGDDNVNVSENTTTNRNYKPGSMMAKANMVKDFNEKNNKN